MPDEHDLKLININLWGWSHIPNDNILYQIENRTYQKQLKSLKETLELYWNDISLDEFETIYILNSDKLDFNELSKTFSTSNDNLKCFAIKGEQVKDTIKYTLLINQYFYFVLTSKEVTEDEYEEEIYDWGIVDLPKFVYNANPVFNITIPNTNLVYGISTNYSLSFH
jgi:hypothetical protein